MTSVDTQPIPVTGYSTSRTVEVGLALPTGVVATGAQEVSVTIGVRAVTGTRSFEVGVRMVGVRPDMSYKAAVDRVLITVGGSTGRTGSAHRLDAGRGPRRVDTRPGTSNVTVTAALPAGVTLVAASPPQVQVTVTARSTPAPS